MTEGQFSFNKSLSGSVPDSLDFDDPTNLSKLNYADKLDYLFDPTAEASCRIISKDLTKWGNSLKAPREFHSLGLSMEDAATHFPACPDSQLY